MRSNAMSMVGCQDKQKAILFVCPPPSPLANISRWHGEGPTYEPSRDHPLIWQGGVIKSRDQGRWWPLHWLAASLVIVDNLGLGEEDNYQELASLVLFGFLRQLQASTECSGERFCTICPTARPLSPSMSNDKMMDAITQSSWEQNHNAIQFLTKACL